MEVEEKKCTCFLDFATLSKFVGHFTNKKIEVASAQCDLAEAEDRQAKDLVRSLFPGTLFATVSSVLPMPTVPKVVISMVLFGSGLVGHLLTDHKVKEKKESFNRISKGFFVEMKLSKPLEDQYEPENIVQRLENCCFKNEDLKEHLVHLRLGLESLQEELTIIRVEELGEE